jgi:Spy/CpxP family protein refolding chaperone
MIKVSRKALVLAAFAGFALLATGVAFAAHAQGCHGRGRMNLAEMLGLSQEQQARIDEIRKANQEAMKAARESVRTKRQSLEEAVTAEPAVQATIDARVRELAAAQETALKQSIAMRVKIREVLTPEQRAKAKEIMEHRRMHKGFGKRGPRPGRPGAPPSAGAIPAPPGPGGPPGGFGAETPPPPDPIDMLLGDLFAPVPPDPAFVPPAPEVPPGPPPPFDEE